VLLDTIIVRSLLVPALSYDIGAKIWWPSKLGKSEGPIQADAKLEVEKV
jgi:RND superfamily putative drug exporter